MIMKCCFATQVYSTNPYHPGIQTGSEGIPWGGWAGRERKEIQRQQSCAEERNGWDGIWGACSWAVCWPHHHLLLLSKTPQLFIWEILPEALRYWWVIFVFFHHFSNSQFVFILFLDQVIYPGKVTEAPCFRIGNIGHVSTKDMEHLLHCIKIVLKEMQIPLPVVWLMVKVSFLFIWELF